MCAYNPAGHNPASSTGTTPSLTSILQTLASYAPPNSSPGTQPQLPIQKDEDNDEYAPPPPKQQSPPDPRKALQPHTYQHQQPFSRPPSSSTDPSTLTTYPPSLRYISTLISTQPAIHQRITRLIREQHSHEKQWFRGRQDLIKRIKGRKERQKEADEVLRRLKAGREILGLPVDDLDGKEDGEMTDGDEDDEEKEKELLRTELEGYDAKVWKAQRDMCEAVERELRGMGIPGFCIREGLVRREGSRGLRAIAGEEGGGDGGGGQKSLSVQELVELKRKVLGLLGDLCGEEGG
jgi:hypothetical protein